MEQLGSLLGSLQTTVDQLNGNLEKAFSKEVSVGTGALALFDTPVTVDAVVAGKVVVFGKAKVPASPFPGSALPELSDATRYAVVQVDGRISAAGEVKAAPGVLSVSASAAAKTGFSYAHIRPFAASATRLSAFSELVRTSQLPQRADLAALAVGETLEFAATLNVDFGLKAKYGVTADINGVIGILESIAGSGLSMPVSAHIDFAASAAFGLSLYESFHIAAGCIDPEEPDWVRIRVERERRRSITFGVAVDLTVAYDATAGPKALLDRVFALVPQGDTISTLQEIAGLPRDWDEFKGAITDKAAEVVGRLVNETGWKNALAASPAIARLIENSNKIVRAYDGLDEKVTSIVEGVIARLDVAGLGRVRPLIDQIASIKPATLDLTSLLSEDKQDLVRWIEVLSGQDIEELLITERAQAQLERAVAAAKQLQKFLDGAPDTVLARLHEVLDQSGAAGLVDWLRANATSVKQLQDAGEKAVGDLTRRLVGKALDEINDDDIKRIQKLAANLEKTLNAPKALHDKLSTGIKRLKGTIGFNVSLELSRVTEWSSLVDVELDSQSLPALRAASGLLNGHVAQFLSELDAIKVKKDEEPPYRVREVLLTSRHVRTSAVASFLSILNFSLKEQETSINESSIVVRDTPLGLVREAVYLGGASVRRKEGSATSEGGAWIRITAAGTGADLNKAYTNASPVIRLTYTREDTKSDKESLLSLVQLLDELSFTGATAGIPPSLLGQQTRFSLELEIAGTAVGTLQQDTKESSWNSDVLHAAHRWLADVDRINGLDLDSGREMAVVVRNKVFEKTWSDILGGTPGDNLYEADKKGEFGIRLLQPGTRKFKMEYGALRDLMSLRSALFRNFKRFAAADPSSTTPSTLEASARLAAALFRTGQIGWQPPLFNCWFVLARLLRLDRTVFANARAVATIRTRATSSDDWSGPKIFTLMNGIGPDNLRLS